MAHSNNQPDRMTQRPRIEGKTPSVIQKHVLSDTYEIVGIALEEFTKVYAGQEF